MRWKSSNLITGVQSLFGNIASRSESMSASSIDSIREAMLEALGVLGTSHYPVIDLRVRYASDIQDLWYLRGDMMAALATQEGEVSARVKLEKISEMFRGLLPNGMNSRPSPLSA